MARQSTNFMFVVCFDVCSLNYWKKGGSSLLESTSEFYILSPKIRAMFRLKQDTWRSQVITHTCRSTQYFGGVNIRTWRLTMDPQTKTVQSTFLAASG